MLLSSLSFRFCFSLLLLTSFLEAYYLDDQPNAIATYFKPIDLDPIISSGLEGIDCCYMINLDKRPEKYIKASNDCTAAGLSINRFSAINGWELGSDSNQLFGPYTNKKMHAKGHLGCILSHLSILQDAANRSLDRIWILEDDIKFVEKITQLTSILNRLDRIDPDWDVYYTDPVGWQDEHRQSPEKTRKEMAYWLRPDQPSTSLNLPTSIRKLVDRDIMTTGLRSGAHSMIVSQKGINKILYHYTHTYLYGCYDRDIHFIDTIREYSCPRNIVTIQGDNIHDTSSAP